MKPKQKSNTITAFPEELTKLYKLSTEMADLTETLLEDKGAYNKEFVRGLKVSIASKKVKKIDSLSDLP